MGKINPIVDLSLQIVYANESNEDSIEEIFNMFWLDKEDIDLQLKQDVEALSLNSIQSAKLNDDLISQFLVKSWSIDRIAIIEKLILRLALSELNSKSRSVALILRDYTAIAKYYGDNRSAIFINGILDNISKTFEIN